MAVSHASIISSISSSELQHALQSLSTFDMKSAVRTLLVESLPSTSPSHVDRLFEAFEETRPQTQTQTQSQAQTQAPVSGGNNDRNGGCGGTPAPWDHRAFAAWLQAMVDEETPQPHPLHSTLLPDTPSNSPRRAPPSSPSNRRPSGALEVAARPEQNLETESKRRFAVIYNEKLKEELERIKDRIEKTFQESLASIEMNGTSCIPQAREDALREKVRNSDSKSHPPWEMKAALSKRLGDIVVDDLVAGLAPNCPAEIALARALSAGKEDVIREILKESGTMKTLAASIHSLVQEVSKRDASTGAELNDKFLTSPGRGFEMVFGTKADFFRGLEELVGSPDPCLMTAIIKEHCGSWDSKRNWPDALSKQDTNSKTEFLHVMREIVDQCRADLDDKFPKAWHATAAMLLEAKDPLIPYEAWPHEWPRVPNDPRNGHRFLTDLFELNKELEEQEEKQLTIEEGAMLRLYTGALYVKYNIVPRGGALTGCKNPDLEASFRELCGDGGTEPEEVNRYTTSIHTLASGVVKLSQLTPVQKVYRGIRDNVLPKQFWKPDKFDCKGGMEFGFMSTTTKRDVASEFSGNGDVRMVMELETGSVDRGADLQRLSQYPRESEILFPPLTSLEVRDTEIDCSTGPVLLLKTKANVNLRNPTIDETIAKRYQTLVKTMEANILEAKQHFQSPRWKEVARSTQHKDFLDFVTKKMKRILSREAAFYNDDAAFLAAMEQLTQVLAEVREQKSSLLRELGSELADKRLKDLADVRETMEVSKKTCSFTFTTDTAGMGDLWVFKVLGLRKAQDGLYYPVTGEEEEYRDCLLNKKPFASKKKIKEPFAIKNKTCPEFPQGMALLSVNGGRRDLETWALEVQQAWREGVEMHIDLAFGGPRSGKDFVADLLGKIRAGKSTAHLADYLLCNQKQQELDLCEAKLGDEEAKRLFEALATTAGVSRLELLIVNGNPKLQDGFASALADAITKGCLPRMKLLQLAGNKRLGRQEIDKILEASAKSTGTLEVLGLSKVGLQDADGLSPALGALLQGLRSLQLDRNCLGSSMASVLAACFQEAAAAAAAAAATGATETATAATAAAETATASAAAAAAAAAATPTTPAAPAAEAGAGEAAASSAETRKSLPIEQLWLQSNPQLFTTRSSKAFLDLVAVLASSASGLQELRLYETGLAGAEAVAGLAAALPSLRKLRDLRLYDNPALFSESDEAGTQAFMEGLGCCSEIEDLWLYNTGLAKGAEALAKSLPKLQKLRVFLVNNNPGISEPAKRSIHRAVRDHGRIEEVRI